VTDPNPQTVEFSAYEAVKFVVTMRPPLTTPWPGSATFELNIRTQLGEVVIQSTNFTVTDSVNGVVEFNLTSTETGDLSPGDATPTPGGGDFLYDLWRTDAGNEKRLAWGPLIDLGQQWKP
jgi:hypothetical protein